MADWLEEMDAEDNKEESEQAEFAVDIMSAVDVPESDTGGSDDEDDVSDAETDGGVIEESEGSGSHSLLAELVPEAMTLEEAQQREYRWRIMVWGSPGMGKTHFAYTMPGPIAFIDTESKSQDISHKFGGKDVVIFQPQNYEEALQALKSAIEALNIVYDQTGEIGTIVVDSMSIMWEWAQQHYVDMYYPGKDVEDVNFKSGLQGNSDWKQIKRFHNKEFRQRMVNTRFHLLWTAMREDDYEKVFDNGERADKPGGEKNNRHKIDQVIRLKQGSDGRRVGQLQKSGFVRHEYHELEYPTFEKHQAIVEAIAEAEAVDNTDEDLSKSIETPYPAKIVDGGSN